MVATKKSSPKQVRGKKPKSTVTTSKKLLALPEQPRVSRLAWLKSHPKLVVPSLVLAVLLLLTAIPATRYLLPGLFVKKDVLFVLQDPAGETRISDADVSIDGKLFTSDPNGVIHANGIRPGVKTIVVSKLFYKTLSQKVTISLFRNREQFLAFQSTGRPAKVTVKNRLSGRVLSGILVKTEQGSQAKTRSDGTAMLVLPSTASEMKATISGDGIVTNDVIVRAVQDDTTNVYRATPSGKVYFLSKENGTIDVVKTNLDGTDRQTVLAGTGRESDNDTFLLASKDWKYLALKSHREGDLAQLYLIDTSTDAVSPIDAGNASFGLIGWDGASLIYRVDRNGMQLWQPKKQALKAYNAKTRQLITLDETRAAGTSEYSYASESFQDIYVLDQQIVYTKTWYASYYYGTLLADKTMTIAAVQPDGSGKKSVHDWPAGYYTYSTSAYKSPGLIYYRITLDGAKTSFWQYTNGGVKENTDLSNDDFTSPYPTYFESPNGVSTFWSEQRDGKNTLFIGDTNGQNSKQIATLSEFVPYGWFSDDYVLVSKSNSELYIMGRDGIKPGDVPTKISDYHRPSYQFFSDGMGYGGY